MIFKPAGSSIDLTNHIAVRLTKQTKLRLDVLCKALHLSRGALCRQAIEYALDNMDTE